jgi:hypothetical protein
MALVDHRQRFETKLKAFPRETRAVMARTALADLLCAFCFDPDPRVIAAVLDNPHVDQTHARLIAEHHHTGAGLEMLGRRATLLRDAAVRRNLFRNAQTPQPLMQRMLAGLPLIELHKLLIGRQSTEQAKARIRQQFRARFQNSEGEEKAATIITTEGRCLIHAIGLTLDGKTTAILCRRSIYPTIFVQNLCRFPATPPKVLAHLLRQSTVQRNGHLRQAILRHPNCPSGLKRGS